MTAIHISPEVRSVRELHPYLADSEFRARPIREQIAAQADTLHAAFQARDERVAMHVLSWSPKARGATRETMFALDLTPLDALETMSREYGFSGAEALDALGDLRLDEGFEAALDHMLFGEIDELEADLERTPGLAAARSRFGHRATLLHYLGANGVESHRQITPGNAPDLAALLISRGASKSAEAEMYGGGQTARMLAATSAHPRRAGIAEELGLALS
ncbi:MAG: hypothetical protein AAGF90_23580 [Pseudomonadota bacterium]